MIISIPTATIGNQIGKKNVLTALDKAVLMQVKNLIGPSFISSLK